MFFSLGPDVTDFGELVDGSKEVHYRVTFSFYIWTMTTEDWEDWIKLRGGVDIACSLVSLIACIIGLVGIQRRNTCFVSIFSGGVILFSCNPAHSILELASMLTTTSPSSPPPPGS